MKEGPASYAKVTRPIPRGAFPRERLFALLDRMRDRPILWVTGPPGSGKTTLASTYLEARGLASLWYQVDQGDTDLATFFYYLGLGLKRAAPHKRKPMPLLTQEYLPGIVPFTLRFFETLFNRLKPASLLVLDNYQELPEDSSAHSILQLGLSRMPPGMNAMIISRHAPPQALARWMVNGEMSLLGWGELELTLEEARGIVNLSSAYEYDEETSRSLHQKSGGWVAGLVLSLEAARREKSHPKSAASVSLKKFGDYFSAEVFQKMEGQTQEFLLRTSFLHKMTPSMARSLTGEVKAGQILEGLVRNNFFTARRRQGVSMYEYHPLFREFLEAKAREILGVQELSQLRNQAAQVLEANGETAEAIRLLAQEEAWEQLSLIFNKHAPGLLEQGRHRTLASWLGEVPEDVLGGFPWMLYWRGLCRMHLDPASARQDMQRAFQAFGARAEVQGLFLAWCGVVDAVFCLLDDFSQFDPWISTLERLLSCHGPIKSPALQERVAASMFTALALRQPWHRDLDMWAKLALGEPGKGINSVAKLQAYSLFVYYCTYKGLFQEAERAIQEVEELCRQNPGPLILILLRAIQTIFRERTGKGQEALEAARDGLRLSGQTGIHVFDRQLMGAAVANALNMGDLETASQWLEKMAPLWKPPGDWTARWSVFSRPGRP